MTITVDRAAVLAYRAFVQGLHRDADADAVAGLAVLDLGVQDTPAGSAAHALAARLASPPAPPVAAALSEAGLVTTWSVRGAPHVHRAAELAGWSRALWPWSDDDALARLDTAAGAVRATGLGARAALRLVATEVAGIVTEPMAKGDVSAALTPRVPSAMTVDCRRCEATHLVEQLFRGAVLPAGVTFDPGQRVVTFVAVPDWPGVPEETVGAARLVATSLRLLGPATPAEVAGFLATRPAELGAAWPENLAEVEVAGARKWIPADAVGALTSPPDPPAVRLLPPSDPLLQARDRTFLVPDPAHRKALWPILGRPGAVLVHGEIAGTWRARKQGRRLAVTVTPFARLPAAAHADLDEEAARLAAVRGTAAATVTVEDAPAEPGSARGA